MLSLENQAGCKQKRINVKKKGGGGGGARVNRLRDETSPLGLPEVSEALSNYRWNEEIRVQCRSSLLSLA